MGYCSTSDVILLNDIKELHMLSIETLVPKNLDVCLMQQGIKFTKSNI